MALIQLKSTRFERFLDALYIPAILRGFRVTTSHLFRRRFTQDYPEEKRTLPKGYRGKHKLNLDQHDHVKCVACYLCGTACPADAILIESAPCPKGWEGRDRYPSKFEIDTMKCIYCGFCEEACPVDAIILTDAVPDVLEKRSQFIRDREDLVRQPPPSWSR